MKIKKILIFFLFIMTLFIVTLDNKNMNISAQNNDFNYVPTSDGGYATYLGTNTKITVPKTYEKRPTEFRGVWVTPLASDIGSLNNGETSTKRELLSVLDNMVSYNLNTIVFHIRTHNDAMYDTKLAPKSPYVEEINFKQWDYLEWFIDECHKRGIEFHAWMNPYRLTMGKETTVDEILNKYKNCYLNPARKEENILIGKEGAILDPGSPEVKKYLVDVCMEVVEKYDIDAIHFDDYFYMKGINDSKTFNKYHNDYNTNDIEEFRRLQVDEFIHNLSKAMYDYNIKNHKAVQLGISPSGCYRNGKYDPSKVEYKYDENGTLISPLYSNSKGYAHYDNPLYSDVKKWVDNEWIDYVIPQLYGSFENSGTRYCDLVDWWSAVCKNKKVNLYPGIGIYQVNRRSDVGWNSPNNKTFESSLLYNQKFDAVKGFCLYSYGTLHKSVVNYEYLEYAFDNFLTTKALNPKSQRYNLNPTTTSFSIYRGEDTYTLKLDKNDNARRYAIYKAKGDIDINNPEHLIGFTGGNDLITFIDEEISNDINYGVRSVTQDNNLSSLTILNTTSAKDKIDFDLATLNDIKVTGKVESNKNVPIQIEQAHLNAGINKHYVLYKSDDKVNWEKIKEYNNPSQGYLTTYIKFNNDFSPVYLKYTIENDYGIMESDILTINFERLKPTQVLEFMVDKINQELYDIFKIRGE